MKEYNKQLKIKILDIDADRPIAVLNSEIAKDFSAKPLDRLLIKRKDSEINCILDITNTYVDKDHIGIFKNLANDEKFKDEDLVKVAIVSQPDSMIAIINKIKNKPLTRDQINAIVKDISENKLTDIEISAFLTACFTNGLNLDETIDLSKALVDVGDVVKFTTKDIVLDKHSIGGLNGRVSMILTPIIASCGYTIPKTASRSITSCAGTADAMEVLAPVSFNLEEIKAIVAKTNGLVAWEGKFDLCPVDNKLIDIEHVLGINPEGVMIASILSKKKSAGVTHAIIDVPVGSQVKIKNKEDGERIAQKFIAVGKELNLKLKVLLTDGEIPCGNAFGAGLEARGVLEILEGKYFDNLAEKSCELAGELLELVGKTKDNEGYKLAKEIVTSGKALEKFKEIITAQGGKILASENVPLAQNKKCVYSKFDGKIVSMSVSSFTRIARTAGAPGDILAGILLKTQTGDQIKKGDLLFEIYSQNADKLEHAYSLAEELDCIQLQSVILEEIQ
ncbi:MAG: thymidine phosphorylase [archaeon]